MKITDTLTLSVVGRLCAARYADGITHAAVAGPGLTAALDTDCAHLTDDERHETIALVRNLVDGARAISVGARMELELHHPVGGGPA